ncbi:MAG TPA: hypothetical protein VHG69_02585 [Thermoleophilaceae bacterium]|nr:hypothetical protein [Thermoleophilaceae bacterium]
MRRSVLVSAAALLLLPATAGAQVDPVCSADTEASEVEQKPGPPLRFGIGPLPQAGQIGGNPAPAVPEQPDRTHAFLGELRPAGGPFVLRLNRFFWSDGEEGFQRYLGLARRFARRGYLVELQVRYHPSPEQEGNIAAWAEHVRQVVRRFGPIKRVVALQITNEVNITFSPDSSDGAYEGARLALVEGVKAARDEAAKLGYRHLAVGFNWAYRTDPANETSFWQSLRDRGGPDFVRAVEWIGLDAYPGTVFPPAESEGGERDGMVNAMSALRCYARIPGIPESVPMKIEENGWPTQPPGRSYEKQARVLELMVRAAHDFRGTYNVTDYRWFNLRDGDTASPLLFQHFGLLESDYDKKPAFDVYRRLVGELSVRSAGRARLRLRLRARRARVRRGGRACVRGPVRVAVVGPDAGRAVAATFFEGRRRAVRDGRRPLRAVVGRRRHRGRSHVHRVRVLVRLSDGRLVRLAARYRACADAPRRR